MTRIKDETDNKIRSNNNNRITSTNNRKNNNFGDKRNNLLRQNISRIHWNPKKVIPGILLLCFCVIFGITHLALFGFSTTKDINNFWDENTDPILPHYFQLKKRVMRIIELCFIGRIINSSFLHYLSSCIIDIIWYIR